MSKAKLFDWKVKRVKVVNIWERVNKVKRRNAIIIKRRTKIITKWGGKIGVKGIKSRQKIDCTLVHLLRLAFAVVEIKAVQNKIIALQYLPQYQSKIR